MRKRAGIFAGAALAAGLFAAPAGAADVAGFYKDNTVAILMGTGPGASYDLYGRTIAQYLGKYIPGNPKIIVEHMPGAGGVIAGNHIFNVAPQDGTKILLAHAIPVVEALGDKVQFESRRFQWLGAYDEIIQSLTLWHTAPAKTIEEVRTSPDLVVGSFANSHITYQWAMLIKNVLGAKYKVITGYRGGNDLNLAMERGEVHGWTASWESIAGARPQWVAEKKVNILIQCALERQRELPEVPTLLELAPADKKELVAFITAGTPIARAMAVGPKVPADRVAALRKAFDDLMQDQAFLAEAEKRTLRIHPRNWEKTQALVEKVVTSPPELVKRVKQAIGMEEQGRT